MSREEPLRTDGGEAAETAFSLVGNETRAEILRVLGEDPWEPASFSDLRSAVDPDIDSGQFNYHLQQLVGVFVERTDEGYRLRSRGATLYRTLRAGTFTRSPDVAAFDAGFDCHFCGGRPEARYGDGTFDLECPDCGHLYTHSMAPPSTFEDVPTPEDLLDRVDSYTRHQVLAYARGVCPHCVTGLDVSLVDAEDVWTESAGDLTLFARYHCPHCDNRHFVSLGMALLSYPALVAFCYERGLDVTSVPHWELEFVATDRTVTVHSRDPWEVSLAVALEGDRLELVVDDSLEVVETHRE
ncbi:helix-turn-helix domain-containing protein [Salinirubellus salinus]|uniref:Helix-turn-helix domain-containing protein n=1 Tax=Salinirubellus salinus TaxID=1364945 RepID=A0A9E7U8Q7_9EURY|nr:helix-turn-helix domain-containing protein [Salinirubellus salinus]UWM55096.1 helix-turn-helix domain-containing protein [Salinirubellus salinus]